MTREELAKTLDGREYREEITKPEIMAARSAGLVVAFGYSDDNLELRGWIDEEIDAYEGASVFITPDGDIRQDYTDGAFKIAAEWAPTQIEASWLITANVPHSTFDVHEDGELYCRGLVIDTKEAFAPHRQAATIRSAAPEMYEALMTVLPYIECAEEDEAYKPGVVAKVTAQVRAALAKAEGRQP